MIGPDLCDFSDAYIVVKVEVNFTGESNSSRKNRSLPFKSNVWSTNCISKINNVLIDNAECLDL